MILETIKSIFTGKPVVGNRITGRNIKYLLGKTVFTMSSSGNFMRVYYITGKVEALMHSADNWFPSVASDITQFTALQYAESHGDILVEVIND